MKEERMADGCSPLGEVEAGSPPPLLDTGYPQVRPLGQEAGLVHLAYQALHKANRAQAVAEVCKETGDHEGWWNWRRQMLRHQAILWATSRRLRAWS